MRLSDGGDWGGMALKVFLPGLFALTVVVYVGSVDNPFQYDDHHSIVDNPHIRSLENAVSFFWNAESFSEDPGSAMYRPLVLITYAVNYALHGHETTGYHLLNIAIHALNSCLAYLLVRQLGGSLVGAVVASIVFALHPVNGEAVNYISSRSESLCATFYILTFLFYQLADGGERNRLLPLTVLSVVSFGLALMSKSVAITLPALLLTGELLRKRGGSISSRLRLLAMRQWPFWVIGAIYLLYTANLVSSAMSTDSVRGLSQQLGTQTKALVYYATLLCLPAKLSVEHQFGISPGLMNAHVIVSALVILSATVVIWKCRHMVGEFRIWTLWPMIVLLPTFVIPLNVLVNEHRLYLPLLAFAVFLGFLFERLIGRKRQIGFFTVACLFAVFATLAQERSSDWRDSFTLWSDAMEKGPFMPRPHIYVGDSYHSEGDYEGALAEYQTALEIYPEALSPLDRVVALNNMGASYLKIGSFTEAVHAYQRALRLDSTYHKSRDALDALLALRQDASNPQAKRLFKRGMVQLAAGKSAEAVVSFAESVSLHPLGQTWLALALAYESLEAWEEAAQSYEVLEMVATRATLRATAREGLARTRAHSARGESRATQLGERGGA